MTLAFEKITRSWRSHSMKEAVYPNVTEVIQARALSQNYNVV